MKDGYEQGIQNVRVNQAETRYELISRALIYHMHGLGLTLSTVKTK